MLERDPAGPAALDRGLRDVLGERERGVRSVPEAGLRDVILASDLPEPLWNPRLETLDGAFIAEPDAYYEDLGIALEVDSREHHYRTLMTTRPRGAGTSATTSTASSSIASCQWTSQTIPSSVLRAIRSVRAAHEGRRPPRIRVTPVDKRASMTLR